jgi:hypothetical protein
LVVGRGSISKASVEKFAERLADALLEDFSHEGKFECAVHSVEEGELLVAAFVARGCQAGMMSSKLIVFVTCPPLAKP